MARTPIEAAAAKAGIAPEPMARLVALGLAELGLDGEMDPDQIGRAQVFHALERAGLPLDGIAQLIRDGTFSMDFIESAVQPVLAPMKEVTFAQRAEETATPVELLMSVREAIGGGRPEPDDAVAEDEIAIFPLIEMQHSLGFSSDAIVQALWVYGDSLRRMAETEGEWWRTEVQIPMLARGGSEDDVGKFAAEVSARLSQVSDEAVLAIYHIQQLRAWMVNIVGGMAYALEKAGLHIRDERPPAMCFLDITGYTQLTHEQGDRAAAGLAERIRRIVERSALEHGGRAVKWLGDGVMLHFPEPGQGVLAALDMVDAIAAAGLPPAHVGLHAGPVVFQEGDYYGQTVNIAARIADYARPGEVLVSEGVVEASGSGQVVFERIGPVELKGVAEAVGLHTARRGFELRSDRVVLHRADTNA